MKELTVVKVGGNLIDDANLLSDFLDAFSKIEGKKLLVHGGGKLATELSQKLDLEPKMVNGRRITNAEDLKLVTMVYAGFVNKNIVVGLQSRKVNVIGLSGCDLDIMRAKKRVHPSIDYGFVGDIVAINEKALSSLIEQGQVPVLAPITHDGNGQLLNTNADSIVTEVAIALAHIYRVKLIYSFEKAGVLYGIENEFDTIPSLNKEQIKKMQTQGSINTGMMPKTDNALKAASNGVAEVIIGNLVAIQNGKSPGTQIIGDHKELIISS